MSDHGIPRLVKDLLECDELKDFMVGLAISSGADEKLVNLPQSKLDETYEWFRTAEANNETGPPSNILRHYNITFEQKSGWEIDAYHFESAPGYRRLMCKIFRPSGDAYGCLSVSEVTWSGVLGLNYHSQYEGKDCHCVNCDRWNYDGIVFQRLSKRTT